MEARLADEEGRTRAKAEAQCAAVERVRFVDCTAPRPRSGDEDA
ncbi:MAG: hypothetical protein R2726_06515 [Acidimicrobiales bacterium]